MQQNELSKWLEQNREKRQRATARLEQLKARGPHFYFGFIGLSSNVPSLTLPGFGFVQRISEAPSELDLASATKPNPLRGAVSRYLPSVNFEVAVSAEHGDMASVIVSFGWWYLSALRIRTGAGFLVPVVSDQSWSTIAGITDGSCNIRLLEDVPLWKPMAQPVVVHSHDFEWAHRYLSNHAKLCQIPKYFAAIEALALHQHTDNSRMRLASLWSGIESLFAVGVELRFRLSLYAAAFLESRGPARREMYNRMKDLYDIRSKAVHGLSLSDVQLETHVCEVRQMLCRVLTQVVENGGLPDHAQIEKSLLE